MLIVRATRHMCGGCGLACLLVFALLASSAVPATGVVRQDPAPDSDAPTVLRVETRLVQVDVVVRSDDGLVADLTAGDFSLYVDGEETEITVFEVTRASARAPATSPLEPRPLGERVVSNHPAGPDNAPASATIILMDRLNTEALDQPRANAQLLEFLESLDGRHAVAIYELRGQLRLIQDYTNDRDVLLRAARSTDTDFSSQLDASYGEGTTGGFEAGPDEVGLDPGLVNARLGVGIEDRGTAQIDQFVASFYVNNRIRITAEVLEALAIHMSGLGGRKNLVWLSGRFPFSFEPRSGFAPGERIGRVTQLERTARVLTDANVAVYPISAVGLLAPLFNEPGATLYPGTTNFGGRLAREPASTNTMRQIARMTGGEAYYLTNGLAEAMTEATEDTEVVYTLGFYPDSASLDDDFHELRVEVARDDVDVRHRRGYYGFGTPDAPDQGGRIPIVDLVTSPVNATAIGLTATTVTSDRGGSSYSTHLRADVNDLDLVFRDNVWVGAVEIATLIVEAGADAAAAEVGTLDIVLTDEQLGDAMAAGGYELFSLSSIQADEAWLRVVVRETISGAIGSLWVALD